MLTPTSVSSAGGEFGKGWSDEQAMKESACLFPSIPDDQLGVICDDCFNMLMANLKRGC